MNKQKVSVIVLNWNGKRFLYDCLNSLLNQDYSDFEVVLVDNGSTDDSLGYVKKTFGHDSRLRILALEKNYGFAKGNNMGVKFASGSYVIILNNDTIVDQKFISSLTIAAESNTAVGSVGCKIVMMNGATWLSQKFTNRGFVVPFFLQNLVKEKVDYVSTSRIVNLANSGCACLFTKKVFDELGGYDEDFVTDWEDWDLGYRINLAGYNCIHLPIELVLHYGGGSAGYPPERYTRIYRNMLFSLFKNYELTNLITRFSFTAFFFLPLFHVGLIVRQLANKGTKFQSSRMLDYFLSFFRAYYKFLLDLTIICQKRYKTQKLRRATDKLIFRKTFIRFFL